MANSICLSRAFLAGVPAFDQRGIKWAAMKTKSKIGGNRRRTLHPKMDVNDFRSYYWMKADLVAFARRLGLPCDGHKPELSTRIERRLRGLPPSIEPRRSPSKAPRDSDQPLRRGTPVVNYRSDQTTRAFFQSQIGREFHFTYLLNQYRLARENLTYGDLVDEWVAERDRRRDSTYQAPIPEQGKYNRFIRDFFADKKNRGKSLGDAAVAWNRIKGRRGRVTDTSWQPGSLPLR